MAAEKTVDSWMSRLEPDCRPVAEAIRKLVLEADSDLSEAIKWGNPTYEKQGKVCYLAATKSYVSLGFFNGAGLTDPHGRIEGTGKKMRHIKVKALSNGSPPGFGRRWRSMGADLPLARNPGLARSALHYPTNISSGRKADTTKLGTSTTWPVFPIWLKQVMR